MISSPDQEERTLGSGSIQTVSTYYPELEDLQLSSCRVCGAPVPEDNWADWVQERCCGRKCWAAWQADPMYRPRPFIRRRPG